MGIEIGKTQIPDVQDPSTSPRLSNIMSQDYPGLSIEAGKIQVPEVQDPNNQSFEHLEEIEDEDENVPLSELANGNGSMVNVNIKKEIQSDCEPIGETQASPSFKSTYFEAKV